MGKMPEGEVKMTRQGHRLTRETALYAGAAIFFVAGGVLLIVFKLEVLAAISTGVAFAFIIPAKRAGDRRIRWEVLLTVVAAKVATCSGDHQHNWRSLGSFLRGGYGSWTVTLETDLWGDIHALLGISNQAHHESPDELSNRFTRWWFETSYPELWYSEVFFREKLTPGARKLYFAKFS